MDKKTITIKVKNDVNLYISDILCWFAGYRADRDNIPDFLDKAISELRALNTELKSLLMK